MTLGELDNLVKIKQLKVEPPDQAMVEVMQPAVQGRTNVAGGRKPGATNSGYVVADPVCGTGGFLLAA